MKLYNSADRRLVDFVPLEPGKVSMYCCGPTVYNYAHVGNFRAFLFEDFLRRTLAGAGYSVTHVMNVTDVGHLTDDGDQGEDKMLKGARESGKTVWDVARFYTEAFFLDSARLNLLRPTIVAPATDHIPQMIALIERLQGRGLTYQAGGNVYFNTGEFPDYGKMALLDRQEAPAISRVDADAGKKNPRDFVLWFTQSKFEGQAMTWDSPWGRGYPGWHIECSAMGIHHLGERFDIHCGGIDHIPVHHTNEIAQSEGALGHKWVNYWLHNEFLLTGKDKMSKSSGEFLTVQLLIEKGYDPLDYRFFCFGAHYRSALTFTWEALDGARNARRNLTEKVLEWKTLESAATVGAASQPHLDAWRAALENDLSTPMALASLWALVKDPAIGPAEKLAALFEMDAVLGLGLATLEVAVAETAPSAVLVLAAERAEVRRAKNFARSDEIRDELRALGWAVTDTPAGPQLKKL
ncbi:MAG: cysteine--tRNA ligase [Spirochaetales bacterium]